MSSTELTFKIGDKPLPPGSSFASGWIEQRFNTPAHVRILLEGKAKDRFTDSHYDLGDSVEVIAGTGTDNERTIFKGYLTEIGVETEGEKETPYVFLQAFDVMHALVANERVYSSQGTAADIIGELVGGISDGIKYFNHGKGGETYEEKQLKGLVYKGDEFSSFVRNKSPFAIISQLCHDAGLYFFLHYEKDKVQFAVTGMRNYSGDTVLTKDKWTSFRSRFSSTSSRRAALVSEVYVRARPKPNAELGVEKVDDKAVVVGKDPVKGRNVPLRQPGDIADKIAKCKTLSNVLGGESAAYRTEHSVLETTTAQTMARGEFFRRASGLCEASITLGQSVHAYDYPVGSVVYIDRVTDESNESQFDGYYYVTGYSVPVDSTGPTKGGTLNLGRSFMLDVKG